jgi:polysaccharide export outer membrane protein
MRMRHSLLCLVAGMSAMAADGLTRASAGSVPAAAAPAGYVLAPGDVIEVSVTSHAGYDRILTVQPDGRIAFAVVGEIVATGCTPAQLATRLREGLKVELIDPQVTVGLKEMHRGTTRQASVLGAVRSPGVFELKEKLSLAELLAAAGGPLPIADLGRVETIDFSGAAESGQAPPDVVVEAGDLIIVPTGTPPMVTVLGQVARTGSYPIPSSGRLLDAIIQAGGPTVRADLAHVNLVRGAGTQTLDLQSVTTGRAAVDSPANPRLRPGDTIVLAENEQRVYILGEVARADGYALQGGDRILDLITRAGGPTREAAPAGALLFRRSETGEPMAQSVDLKGLLTKGDLRNNLLLRRGDVLLIPSSKAKTPSAVSTLLYPITGLLGLLR